jgi:hypothetical protein
VGLGGKVRFGDGEQCNGMREPFFSYISLSSIGDEILWWFLYRHEDNEVSLTCAFRVRALVLSARHNHVSSQSEYVVATPRDKNLAQATELS